MKLLMPCMVCFQELGTPTNEFLRLQVQDDGRYEIKCSRGHNSLTVLQNQKFEILFDIGANAILDGYYREAVSSFTSSLERFYEFCVKLISTSRKIDKKEYSSAWKNVSNQSERQLGAFIFLWTTELKKAPKLLPNKMVKFRNEVIHKGKIPTYSEAITYGQAILFDIREKMEILKSKYKEEITQVTVQHIMDCAQLDDGQVGGQPCAPIQY